MATKTVKAAAQATKTIIGEGQQKIDAIKREADEARPKLQVDVEEYENLVSSARKLVDDVAADIDMPDILRKFIRRMLSREMIIAAVSIIAIWQGGLDAEQSIGIAVAGSGLVLGRSVAKAKSGETAE